MRRALAAGEKPLHWIGSSKDDFLEFPAAVKDDMGNALGIAQFGGAAPTVKPCRQASEDGREGLQGALWHAETLRATTR